MNKKTKIVNNNHEQVNSIIEEGICDNIRKAAVIEDFSHPNSFVYHWILHSVKEYYQEGIGILNSIVIKKMQRISLKLTMKNDIIFKELKIEGN